MAAVVGVLTVSDRAHGGVYEVPPPESSPSLRPPSARGAARRPPRRLPGGPFPPGSHGAPVRR